MIENMFLCGGNNTNIKCEHPTNITRSSMTCTVTGLTHKPFAFAYLSNSWNYGTGVYTTYATVYCEDTSGQVMLNQAYYYYNNTQGSIVRYSGMTSSVSYDNGTLTIVFSNLKSSYAIGGSTSSFYCLYIDE